MRRLAADLSLVDVHSSECRSRNIQGGHHAITDCAAVRDFPIECAEGISIRRTESVSQMTSKERLAELEMQHKALEHEIAEALEQHSIDDLKIKELKRRKLMLKDEIERLRHDHTL